MGREVSKQPPWSIETSTSTAWRFIRASWSRLITYGARAPCTSTAPITRSAMGSMSSIASVDEYTVEARPPKATSSSRRRSMLRSNTNTSASMPIAMNAAFWPTTPPPITSTVAAATPGTPPSSTPPPAHRLLEEERPGLRGDLARHLRHRREERQAALGVHHSLVRDAGGAGAREALGQLRVGRQVQVGEERVLRPEGATPPRAGAP